jgi:gluconolactonase
VPGLPDRSERRGERRRRRLRPPTSTNGAFDGFRFDSQGHIWTSAGDGVHVLHPDGTLLGKVLVPEAVANVCFGGPKRNRLYICATTSLYAVLLPVRGA